MCRYNGSAIRCGTRRVLGASIVDIQCSSHSTHSLVNIPHVDVILKDTDPNKCEDEEQQDNAALHRQMAL